MVHTIRLLFLAATSFLFLSSSAAALLGLQQARVALFSAIVALLAGACVLYRPIFARRGHELPVVLLWLLTTIALLDAGGTFDLLDYKILLPIVALLMAPHLAHALEDVDLAGLVAKVLGLYVLAMAVTVAAGADNVVLRGHDALMRLDLTGSVITHASLCTIALVLACNGAVERRGFARFTALLVALLALLMVLLSATRTALLTLVLMGLLSVAAGPERSRQLRTLVFVTLAGLVVFAVHTVAVSDAFLLRLVGDGTSDFTSGRSHSLVHWLALAADRPFGHGIGAVRSMMTEGRPWIEGGRMLEWPHNEFVRFYFEAGLPGLLMVTLLIGGMLARTLRAAAIEAVPARRALMLVLAADMVTQSVLQNYFNTVYHATVLLMILAVVTEPRDEAVERHETSLHRAHPGQSMT
ncbi:MAG: O-antigen ligase family protein [Geminicoccaceae bacterium]|nr:O-antigen ligase family protein [Geminicoccaceae bacterium]